MTNGRPSRFLLILVGLLALAVVAFAACGDGKEEATLTPTTAAGETPAPTVAARPGNVDAVIVWGAEEIDKFDAMTKPWIDDTGNSLDFTSTRDINTLLTTRVAGGNPPDVAFPPALGIFRDLARDGALTPLSDCPGLEDKVRADYPQSVVDLGTVDGTLYGVAMKAGYKANVWYNPKAFAAKGYQVPTTWDELIALANKIVADGGTPFSDAEEIGGGSGFPGSDWVQQIVINQWGPDVYDQWVAHGIPYNDDRIKQSWQMFGDIILNPDYILGGTDKALATRFSEGAIPLFKDPPEAYMHVMGSFDSAFITNPELGFPEGLVAGEDFDFFPFPVINPDFPSGVTGDLNMMMMFNNDPETCSFVEWMASADAQDIWVGLGGFTSLNTKIDLNAYPTALDRKVGEILANPNAVFRPDADDAMPSGVGGDNGAVFTGVLDFIDGGNLDTILKGIEDVFP